MSRRHSGESIARDHTGEREDAMSQRSFATKVGLGWLAIAVIAATTAFVVWVSSGDESRPSGKSRADLRPLLNSTAPQGNNGSGEAIQIHGDWSIIVRN